MLATEILRRKQRENRTRWVVLGMLTAGPLTGYGLRRMVGMSVGHFWQESYGQLYPTLRRLAAEGLIEAAAARGGSGRGSTTYRVTPAGRAALAAWLALPPVLEPRRSEILLKVFFAGAGAPELIARNLESVAATVRGQLAELEALERRIAASPGTHPDAPYWRLTLEYGLSALRTSLGWLDRAQGVLLRGRTSGRTSRARPRARAARAERGSGARRTEGPR